MKKILLVFTMMFVAAVAFGQQTYEKGEFVSQKSGEKMLYRYLAPENPQHGKKYPLVIFLHGSGERGNDNQAQLFHGSGQFLNPVNREKYPAYVLFPQCPEGVPGAYMPRLETLVPKDMPLDPPQAPIVTLLLELIDSYIARPDVDPRRVYMKVRAATPSAVPSL